MSNSPDVLLIGGGVAGTAAAHVLHRQGLQVVLVDRWATYPECFKAEKIEADQADLFRQFELMDALLPHTGSIREILRAQDGRITRRVATEQYGIFYHDMVNALRGVLPAEVEFKVGRVAGLETSADRQTVTLATGEVYHPRLVVLASGVGSDLSARLDLKKTMIQKEQCFAAGFNVTRVDGTDFDFDSVTYFPTGSESRIAYLTLFPIGNTMRANFFSCWQINEERTRDFVRQPDQQIARWLPDISAVTGSFRVASRIETARVDLFQTQPPPLPGVVLIADAFQSVCPITGTGLSKVLTDVDVLCHVCVPEWFASPGMAPAKIASFYQNVRKQAVDQHSLAGARYARQITMDSSLGWRLRRVQRNWEDRLTEALDRFTLPKDAAVHSS